MTTYLLNSPVLTQYGSYSYRAIDVQEACNVLTGGFTSAIGHESTAVALAELLGIEVPYARVSVTMEPDDRAVVFRLKDRPPAGKILDEQEILDAEHEWGLLTVEPAMPLGRELSVFVSYDRNHSRLAERLCVDLNRAGVDAWYDKEGIAGTDPAFEETICRKIRESDQFLLLASPESAASDYVAKEVEEAERSRRPIRVLHVGGRIDDLPEAWKRRQAPSFTLDYRMSLTALIRGFGPPATVPLLLDDLLTSGKYTVGEAADALKCPASFAVEGRTFRRLPLAPAAYSHLWIVAPSDEALKLPNRPAVLVKCSGPSKRNTVQAILAHRLENQLAPWILYLEGHMPKNAEGYELPVEARHIWKDTVDAAMHLMQNRPVDCESLDVYVECPAILAFEIGARFRQMAHYRGYQFGYNDTYHEVLEGGGHERPPARPTPSVPGAP